MEEEAKENIKSYLEFKGGTWMPLPGCTHPPHPWTGHTMAAGVYRSINQRCLQLWEQLACLQMIVIINHADFTALRRAAGALCGPGRAGAGSPRPDRGTGGWGGGAMGRGSAWAL